MAGGSELTALARQLARDTRRPRRRHRARTRPIVTTSVAAVMEAPGRIALRESAVPDPEPGAVVLAVHLSGICGTDKHTFRGESKQYAGTKHERDLEYPLICGHENVGTVTAVGGRGVRQRREARCRVGDRIVPGANVPCGRCYYCANDFPYYFCQDLEDYGNSLNLSRPPGPVRRLVPVHVPPAGNAAVPGSRRAPGRGRRSDRGDGGDARRRHGPRRSSGCRAGARSGFAVAVLGVGPLGLCHLVKSRMLGAGFVAATDLLTGRLERAAAFGVDLALDAASTDADERVAAILDATDGRGVDVALDCSGVPATFTEALRVVRTGGVVVEAGAFVDMGPVQINPNSDICTRNVSVLGIGGETATEYEPSMRLMAANLDRYPLRSIVSHILPLDRAQEAVLLAQSGDAMQVALDPRLPLGIGA